MKKLVEVQEVSGEGLDGLLGENVMLFCCNYIYAGLLSGVNDKYVKLDNARIVYETGELKSTQWKDSQPLPAPAYVMLSAIEMFSLSGR